MIKKKISSKDYLIKVLSLKGVDHFSINHISEMIDNYVEFFCYDSLSDKWGIYPHNPRSNETELFKLIDSNGDMRYIGSYTECKDMLDNFLEDYEKQRDD